MFRYGLILWWVLALTPLHAQQGFVTMGKGNIKTELRPGGEREPPAAQWDIGSAQGGPVPSNQWYSSLFFSDDPQPLYALPASYRPTATGWEVDAPALDAPDGPATDHADIRYPHRPRLTVQPLGLKDARTRVAKVSDWALELVMREANEEALRVHIARGSPYSHYHSAKSSLLLLPEADGVSHWFEVAPEQRHRLLRVGQQHLAVFVPPGALWAAEANGAMRLTLPRSHPFFTVAVLPDARPDTIALFERHAFNQIEDTRAIPRFDDTTSTLTTRFEVTTRALLPGDPGTLIALYPHHWHQNPVLDSRALLPLTYDSVRGPLRLLRGEGFTTQYTYHGLLPYWPGLKDPALRDQLKALLRQDTQFGAEDLLNRRKAGTYWEGKGLNRAAQVMAIAEEHGEQQLRDDVLKAIQARFEQWFAPEEAAARYLYQHRALGTLIGYPDEYGSAAEMNDHHFHYGYWIAAAAQVALRDPEWAQRSQWGAMVEALIADIATPHRGNAPYPKLRHFDAFEGHSWASGTATFFDGNNHESSSEAIHAWAGLILWGEATGNRAIRDTGIYLYVTEIQAAHHYWFNLHRQVFKPSYRQAAAGIVWGSKYVYATWFSDNPRHIQGINLLPITPASVYLAAHGDQIPRGLRSMDRAFERYLKDGGQSVPDVWQDLFASYLALADPQAALKTWNPQGAVEDGETRTRTFHWLHSLAQMGTPDHSVTANTTLYGVFTSRQGRRTYLAYNASDQPREVSFSDGTRLRIAPRSLGQAVR